GSAAAVRLGGYLHLGQRGGALRRRRTQQPAALRQRHGLQPAAREQPRERVARLQPAAHGGGGLSGQQGAVGGDAGAGGPRQRLDGVGQGLGGQVDVHGRGLGQRGGQGGGAGKCHESRGRAQG